MFDEKILIGMMQEYENKLLEYMTPEEYNAWALEVAKISFIADSMTLPEGDFKTFIFDNLDKIMEDPDES